MLNSAKNIMEIRKKFTSIAESIFKQDLSETSLTVQGTKEGELIYIYTIRCKSDGKS